MSMNLKNTDQAIYLLTQELTNYGPKGNGQIENIAKYIVSRKDWKLGFLTLKVLLNYILLFDFPYHYLKKFEYTESFNIFAKIVDKYLNVSFDSVEFGDDQDCDYVLFNKLYFYTLNIVSLNKEFFSSHQNTLAFVISNKDDTLSKDFSYFDIDNIIKNAFAHKNNNNGLKIINDFFNNLDIKSTDSELERFSKTSLKEFINLKENYLNNLANFVDDVFDKCVKHGSFMPIVYISIYVLKHSLINPRITAQIYGIMINEIKKAFHDHFDKTFNPGFDYPIKVEDKYSNVKFQRETLNELDLAFYFLDSAYTSIGNLLTYEVDNKNCCFNVLPKIKEYCLEIQKAQIDFKKICKDEEFVTRYINVIGFDGVIDALYKNLNCRDYSIGLSYVFAKLYTLAFKEDLQLLRLDNRIDKVYSDNQKLLISNNLLLTSYGRFLNHFDNYIKRLFKEE